METPTKGEKMKLTLTTLILLFSVQGFALTQEKAPAPTHDQVCEITYDKIEFEQRRLKALVSKLNNLEASLNFDDTPGANYSYEMYQAILDDIENTEARILRKKGAIRALKSLADEINCN